MIWIIGEYAERIDNADELLESFLEGFADENSQVQLQLLTAIVKLFLKRPTETQELVQQVLSLATQDSDNPDLRDRGYIYWRLLSTDPGAAKEVVLAEKPLISEETDLLEPTLLDELICHIASLASVYHKPPSAFVEGRAGLRKILPATSSINRADIEQQQQQSVIPSQGDLIGDLLNMDINPPQLIQSSMQSAPYSGVDLLGGGLDALLDVGSSPAPAAAAPPAAPAPVVNTSMGGLLGDIFGLASSSTAFVAPKISWLQAVKGKGLEIMGTFSRRNGQIYMDMTLTNKAMQPMSEFAIQFNTNSFGLLPAQPLQVPTPLTPNQPCDVSLPLKTTGPVQKMDPLNNLQIAIKNNVGVMYFACVVPMNVYYVEDGQMDKRIFLQTWKDIPTQNEVQYNLTGVSLNCDAVVQKLQQNNIFTVAKRNVEGQDMLYQSLKLTNNVWVLVEVKIPPNNSLYTLSIKSVALDVAPGIFQTYETVLRT